jgi:hypothetical protein
VPLLPKMFGARAVGRPLPSAPSLRAAAPLSAAPATLAPAISAMRQYHSAAADFPRRGAFSLFAQLHADVYRLFTRRSYFAKKAPPRGWGEFFPKVT